MRVQSTMRVVRRVLDEGGAGIHVYAFTETFSTLTGGRLGFRVSAEDAASLLRDSILSFR